MAMASVWPASGNSYEFDSYQNHNNFSASSSSSCINGNGTSSPHHPPPNSGGIYHGSAFAAAAAHHAAAWCNYSPYHQTARGDPYLTSETDHRAAFVDSYHPAMRPFTGADQNCTSSTVPWNQASSGATQPSVAASGK